MRRRAIKSKIISSNKVERAVFGVWYERNSVEGYKSSVASSRYLSVPEFRYYRDRTVGVCHLKLTPSELSTFFNDKLTTSSSSDDLFSNRHYHIKLHKAVQRRLINYIVQNCSGTPCFTFIG